jgi:hypothetical protein
LFVDRDVVRASCSGTVERSLFQKVETLLTVVSNMDCASYFAKLQGRDALVDEVVFDEKDMEVFRVAA